MPRCKKAFSQRLLCSAKQALAYEIEFYSFDYEPFRNLLHHVFKKLIRQGDIVNVAACNIVKMRVFTKVCAVARRLALKVHSLYKSTFDESL